MHPVGEGGKWHQQAEGPGDLLGEDMNTPAEEHSDQDSDEGTSSIGCGGWI